MLEGLKRLFSGGDAAPPQGWEDLAGWAQSRQLSFRAVHDTEGFIVEAKEGAQPWRLEWGPSQRAYIQGHELRLRAELGLASDLQVVLMNRQLQESMEKQVFEQYVEGVQTRIDNETPPEMRWLVMFPKLPSSEMGALREHWVALGSVKPWLHHWVAGALAPALAALRLPPSVPMVMMISRGRLTLRTPAPEPAPRDLERWIRCFETATAEARRVAGLPPDTGAPSTQASAWPQSTQQPGGERR